MRHIHRRGVAALLAAAAFLAPAPTRAADPPFTRDIRFLNPFAPGGTSDLIGRILAEQLSRQVGQQVVVENRTGGGGVVATQELVRSNPDGHTLLLASMGILTVTPQMQSLPYDVDRDLIPVTNIASVYNILVTGPNSPVRRWQDLVQLAKDELNQCLANLVISLALNS